MVGVANTVIDLFSGVGGLSLGAARAGFSVALAVEKDPNISKAHAKNFPKAAHLQDDISDYSGEQLLKLSGIAPGQLTGVIGGPPCQGFSSIGQRCVTDSRNQLFGRFFDLVAQMKPLFFLAENVPGIMDPCYDHIRRAAFSKVDEYIVLAPLKIKACDYGAPTKRERFFFIGYRKDLGITLDHADFAPKEDIKRTFVKRALKGLPTEIDENWQTEQLGCQKVRRQRSSYFWDRVQGHVPEGTGDPVMLKKYYREKVVSGSLGTKHLPEIAKRYGLLKPGAQDPISKSSRLKLDDYCPTLRAGTGSDKGSYQAVRPIHPTEPRVITPREAARLQGFPDWFQFAPSKWHSFRMIGNSVSPIVSEFLLTVIKEKIGAADSSKSHSKKLLAAA